MTLRMSDYIFTHASPAGKAFEEPSFSTGMLILPPGAIKPKELANKTGIGPNSLRAHFSSFVPVIQYV